MFKNLFSKKVVEIEGDKQSILNIYNAIPWEEKTHTNKENIVFNYKVIPSLEKLEELKELFRKHMQ